jgi:hypothetical protein
LAKVRDLGVKSIICLLSSDQLPFYDQLWRLIDFYRAAGFTVEHIPAKDGQRPPLTTDHLRRVWSTYQALETCSGSLQRGNGSCWSAIDHIQKQLRRATASRVEAKS